MTGWSYPQRRPHAWDAPKLTAEQRREIIDRYGEGESAVSLAAEFGVSTRYVSELAGARGDTRLSE